jgi:predicted ATPase
MIARVRIVRFKRFADQIFDLSGDSVLLAGPNNSGKTTLLHAIAAWYLALTRWRAERKDTGGKRRISILLDEFTALPLREMNLLWLNRHTAVRPLGEKQPKPAPIYVEISVKKGERVEESLTMEFMYANEKLVYVRPVRSPDEPEPIDELPDFAKGEQAINVVHVPAFSGIGTQEPRHTPGIQNKLVGEGRPGEIVRNLLLDIWEKSDNKDDRPPWSELKTDIERLFQCEILPPEFSDARPYIVCEYRPRASDSSGRPPKLDIANAGSGFHQVLLLLSFFHAREASILLLDEPDAHLHFILQREIFDHVRSVAQRRRCQLLIGTHAEVLLSGSEPDQIISFVSQHPRRLALPADKQRLQEAMRRLTALDLLQADHVRAVLYVEDESDYKILREWANVLDHEAKAFLSFPYVVPIRGKGNFDDAKRHFQCLQLAQSENNGLCILDRDADPGNQIPGTPSGMQLHKWTRYEIENYLLVPQAIKRFIRGSEGQMSIEEKIVDDVFAATFPRDLDFMKDLRPVVDIKGSDFIVDDVLARTTSPRPKKDLYMLAQVMHRDEIHPEVITVLDKIVEITPDVVPSVEANIAPPDSNGVDSDTPPTLEVPE